MKNPYRIILSFIFIFHSIHLHAQLIGIKTIGGAGANYPTINAAVSDLVTKGVGNGGVVFKIRPGVYTERILISEILGSSSGNTVTFESETGKAEDVIITSAGGNTLTDFHTIKLYGCTYVIFQYLTIQNTSNSIGAALWLSGGYTWDTSGKTVANNVIQHCIIRVSDSSASQTIAGIVFSGNTFNMGYSVTIAQDNTIIDNSITGGYYGIKGVQTGVGNLIKSNQITGFYYCGISLERFSNVQIAGNHIHSFRNDGSNRKVYGILQSLNSSSVIYNNMISLKSTKGLEVYGIFGELAKIYYNSIHVYGEPGLSYLVYGIDHELRNNQLSNYSGGLCYQNKSSAPPQAGNVTTSDYNNLFTTGPKLAVYNEKVYNTLTDLQAAAQDTNSLSIMPCFISDLDLHTFNPRLDGKGTPLLDIKEDIDAETRANTPLTVTDIGADEFTPANIDLAVLSVTVPNPTFQGSNKVMITLKNQGLSSLKNKAIHLSYSIDNGATWFPEEVLTATKLTNFDDDETYTFTQEFTVPKGGFYTIRARVAPGLENDINPLNEIASTRICFPIKGLIRIGNTGQAGIDFSSISEFAELLDCAGIYDTVIAEISSGLYKEHIEINPFTGMGNFPVYLHSSTGNPDDVKIEYKGSGLNDAYRGVLILKDLKNFHIENLSVSNTQASGWVTCIELQGTIQNCSLNGNVFKLPLNGTDRNTTVLKMVASGETNMLIANNRFFGGHCGVDIKGHHVNMERNLVKDAVLGVRTAGRHMNISHNEIDISVSQSLSFELYGAGNTFYGIYLEEGDTAAVEGNTIRVDGQVSGILCNIPNVRIANNMISGYLKNNFQWSQGVRINKSGVQFDFNSVHILSPANVSCLHVFQNAADIRMTNNIFSHKGGGPAVKIDAGSSMLQSDHNNFYTNGDDLVLWEGPRKNLADLQAYSGMDQASLSVDPLFTSDDDLHTSNAALADKGLETEGILTDIDGELRCVIKPDIGADEFSDCLDAQVANVWLEGSPEAGIPLPVKMKFRNSGRDALSAIPLSYTLTDNSGEIANVTETCTLQVQSGEEVIYTFSTPLVVLQAKKYELCAFAGVQGDIFTIDNTFCDSVSIIPTGMNEIGNVHFSIYPNPASDHLIIRMETLLQSGYQLALYDPLGREVFTQHIDGQISKFDITGLPEGIYAVRLTDRQGMLRGNATFLKID